MSDFKNRVVLVTGSTKGIGYTIALRFARLGAKIVINGSNRERLDAACKRLKEETGAEVLGALGKVQIEDNAKAVVALAIKEFGRIDILVNNVGVYPGKELKDLSADEWDRVMDINAKSYDRKGN